ncbi:MAG: branched-chain amino acid ABC transporter permease [Actinobacteria bacterium]|jgi:branched-chain amino acid transport system permease protein|nr:branched-chain amino acid ABC transporter permease [Actinomycetota bacterium]
MNWSNLFVLTVSAAIGPEAVRYILGAQGLNIHYGYTGLFNFGQAGFMAVGAYGVAIVSASEQAGGLGYSVWLGVLAGLVAAVLLALLMGVPTLRLRGDYLAIVTIAASEIIRLVIRSERFDWLTGGNSGINGFANSFFDANPFDNSHRYEFGPFEYLGKDLWVMLIGWLVIAFFGLLTFLLMRSPWGRVLRSIRENEDAVRSLGKNVQAYKMQALVLGGVMGAVGGAIYALYQNLALPDDFVTRTTFIAYAALILGGAARVGGPIIGGVIWYGIFAFMTNLVTEVSGTYWFKSASWLPSIVKDNAGQFPFVFLGVALMLLVVFRPQGIFGDRREVELDAR